MSIILRKAAESDINTLSGMLAELFSIEDDFEIDSVKQKKALSLIINGGEEAVIFVAETQSEIIGMINIQKIVSTAVGGYSLLLEDMFVLSEYRCFGVGKMLIEQAVQWGKERQAFRIQLAADIRNMPAINFYYREGFSMSNMVLHYKLI